MFSLVAYALLLLFAARLVAVIPIASVAIYVFAMIKLIPAYFWLLETDSHRPGKSVFQGVSLLCVAGPFIGLWMVTSEPSLAVFVTASVYLIFLDCFYLMGRYCRKKLYRLLNYGVAMYLTVSLTYMTVLLTDAMWDYLPYSIFEILVNHRGDGLALLTFVFPLVGALIAKLSEKYDYFLTGKELEAENMLYEITSEQDEEPEDVK